VGTSFVFGHSHFTRNVHHQRESIRYNAYPQLQMHTTLYHPSITAHNNQKYATVPL
jgi:hypothetical protein